MHNHVVTETTTPRSWLIVDRGLEFGPFSDEERAEIDGVRTPRATYTWVEETSRATVTAV